MAELHPIFIHFHIASLASSVFTMFIATMIAVFENTDFFNRRRIKKIFRGRVFMDQPTCRAYSDKFEFVAFTFLIYGIVTLIVAGLAGFLDASGNIGIQFVNFDNFVAGINEASLSSILGYKVIWAIIGTSYFLFAAALRIYFVSHRKERFFSIHFLYWIVYILSQILGYILLTLVSGAGALRVFGGTLIQDIPFMGDMLPGGSIDPTPIVLFGTLGIVFLIVFAGFSRKPPQNEQKGISVIDQDPHSEETHEEHEITLWPATLALGTVLVGAAIINFTDNNVLAAFGFFWTFFILLLAFIFDEAYTQKLFSRPKEGWVWLFLGSEVILFSMIIGTSFGLRVASGANWPDQSQVLNIPLTALNTFILIISSFTMVKSVEAIQRGKQILSRNYLLATAGLGTLFLSIQVSEYLELFGHHFTPTTNLFGSTFYIQTGLHGAHVFFGVLLVIFTTLRAHQGGFTRENHAGIELVGLYWHFVDLVWIVLFTLVYLI
ncbi:MAG: cytochrome c oxidase subunit 3 [Candidatus Hodarchaeales archaeon]|jgi:heme/copper-type cytochrome/quinol oxidase subunit 3